MRAFALICLIFLPVACGEESAAPKEAAWTPEAPTGRDAWWKAATESAGGTRLVLAPREVRGLLASARRFGFDDDAQWWAPRSKWAYQQILSLDPDDVEANGAVGRKTLQSIDGFAPLWQRIVDAKIFTPEMIELVEMYGEPVDENRAVFLSESEFQIETARLRAAKEHLDKMAGNPEYAAFQLAIERVPSRLRDDPSVHVRVGPFLVFFAARDLRHIEGETDASEEKRVGALRENYERKLKERTQVLQGVVKDLTKLYPELARRHPLRPEQFFFLWIFGDPEMYQDFVESFVAGRPESTYRCGFFHRKDGWGYLYLPRAPEMAEPQDPEHAEPGEEVVVREVPDPEQQLKESLAFIATQQLLRHWARDPADRFSNRFDKSRAYWLKEGLPAYIAGRQMKKPVVGPALSEGWRFGREFPVLQRVIERESRLELRRYREPDPEPDGEQPVTNLGMRRHFADLSWLLVRYLNDDARRKQFESYLISQIEASKPGKATALAEALGLKTEADWRRLEDAVYDTIEGR